MFGDTAINFKIDETGMCRCHGLLSPIHSSTGDTARVTDPLKCIQQRMAMWKATKKGERPLSPYFGCCIRDYVNEPLTGSKLLDLKADLERELRDLFPEPEFKVGPVRVESWARNEVQITTTIGNYELEIPSNAKELELLNSQLRRAMIDLGMTLGI